MVAKLSETLPQTLAKLTQGGSETILLEWIPSVAYRDAVEQASLVQVEVLWFPKTLQTESRVEQAIRAAITEHLPALETLVVIFIPLSPGAYYRNGHHF
jgi:hypothetical protein